MLQTITILILVRFSYLLVSTTGDDVFVNDIYITRLLEVQAEMKKENKEEDSTSYINFVWGADTPTNAYHPNSSAFVGFFIHKITYKVW